MGTVKYVCKNDCSYEDKKFIKGDSYSFKGAGMMGGILWCSIAKEGTTTNIRIRVSFLNENFEKVENN